MPLRILHLEDDPNDTLLVQAMLAQEGVACQVERVTTRQEFVAAVEAGGHDLILADYTLPGLDGKAALDIAREKRPDTPFIILSGTLGEELAIEAVKAGATDYVLKQRMGRLGQSVRHALREAEERVRRQDAERRVQESEERFRQLVESIDEVIWLSDRKKQELFYVSPSYETVYGRSRQSLFEDRRSRIQAIHPEDRDRVDRVFAEKGERGEYTEEEYRIVRPDGAIRWLRDRSFPLHDARGEVYRWVGVAADITEQKLAEEALRASEAKYRRLYESLTDAFCQVDMAGHVQEFNQAYLEMLGYTAEELRHLTFRDLTPAKWHAMEARLVEEQVLKRGYSDIYEKEYIRRDGSVFPIELRTLLLRDKEGRPAAMWGIVRDISERKRMETALASQRQELQTIIDAVPAMIFYKDRENRFVRVNRECERLMGLPKEQLEHKSLFDLFPREQAERFWRDDKEVMASGKPRNGIIESMPSAAGTKWVQTNKVPFANEAGEIIGVIGFGVDITDRKLAEEALRESEEQARASFDQAAVGIVHVAPDGRFLRVNQKYCDIVGYSRAELLTWKIQELTCPEDREAALEDPRRLLEGEISTYSQEKRLVRKDGSLAWVNVTGSLVRFPSGEPKYLIVVVQDITPRKQAEAKLIRQRQELETLMDNVPDVISRLDRQFRYLFVNRRWRRATGLASGQAVGKTFRELGFPGSLCDLWEDALVNVFVTGRMKAIEFTHTGAMGERYYLARVVPEVTSDGRAETALIVSRDVTEERQLRNELAQAQKMEVIGQLAAGIAHDVNNVLMAIAGFATLARMALTGNEQAAIRLEHLEEAVQDASTITKALLVFSHKTPAERHPVDVKDVVRGAARLTRRLLPAAVEVLVECPKEPPLWVMADRAELQQVLLNLAINARDAMPEGGTLRFSVAGDAGEENAGREDGSRGVTGEVRLVVADTGIGIPRDSLNLIFEPFFTTKPVGQGTGLGLAIVKNVVEELGGRIGVESQVGRGTAFTIRLPRTSARSPAEGGSSSGQAHQGKGETILVAEDNLQVLDVLRSGLRQAGYEVLEAVDATEALMQHARWQNRVRLLVLDVDLPMGSGVEVLKKIRRVAPAIPAIIITGNLNPDLGVASDHQTRVLRKPYRLPEFIELVERLLALSRPVEAAR